ncbi:nucleoside monophosphate kinase [Patescibacteria group bacterium]|nr:nucleoside monophosphate kinase [Patescibacteria group bacterium]
MSPRTVFFIGKPGCGKGTQAKLLAKKTGWPILASGDQFRLIAKEDTAVGRKVKEEMEQGLLAPHWFAMYLYQRALFSLPEGESVIFDGFNRKEPEAQLIVDSLKWLNRPFVVLNIEVSDEEVTRRLANRQKNSGRMDDHFVEERIAEFNTYTIKALEIFKEMKVLVEINGEQSPEEVAAEVLRALTIS